MSETRNRALGAALVRQRAEHVPWKTLEKRYGMSRARLYRLWRAACETGTHCPNCGFRIVR